MKNVAMKALGLVMTVFAVSGLNQINQVHASTLDVGADHTTSIKTDAHGGNCCCVSCSQISE